MSNKKNHSKRVLVTGSGTGIGKGIALEFAKKGAMLALHYSHSVDGVQDALEQIKAKESGKAKAFKADFNNVKEIKSLAKQVIEYLGGIDVLINNSGITMNMPLEQTTPEQFDTLFNVNIRAMFFLTQAVVPTMEKQGKGVIINLSSNHAFTGLSEHSVYAATKGAIVAFTRTVSLELAPKGIRVNAIAPGGVLVENWQKAMPEFDPSEFASKLPCGFIASPVDMGNIAVFLASDDARYILGQTILADGGQTAIMPLTDGKPLEDGIQFGKGYVTGLQTEIS